MTVGAYFHSLTNQLAFGMEGCSAPCSDSGTQTLSTPFPYLSKSLFPIPQGPLNSHSTQGKRENADDSMGDFDGPGLEKAFVISHTSLSRTQSYGHT